ncbi:acyl-homoserine-lactone synthase [Azospirillum sp. TSO22-1]|uniref:acyl-homoserine-lactone synthase n=1 Tax=Azospirillum sp. TSO22-1 TaxID=716789 RepID=UPI001FFF9D31|nr:acyl-homoserine-lactone synthase [Azospirillum sp. TSO22-1]
MLAAMHRLRHQVFHLRLGWKVAAVNGMEFDEYDAQDPFYLLYVRNDGEVGGCVRLLPTTGPYMLKNTFPSLAGQRAIPSSPRIWEASRFAVSAPAARDADGWCRASHKLFAAMVEFGLAGGITDFVVVVDLRMERILRRAGWPLHRMADPQQVDVTMAVAGRLEVSRTTLASIRKAGRLDGPVIHDITLRHAA